MTAISLPPSVILTTRAGGLECLEISTQLATAAIYLYGAQVAHFAPTGEAPMLFFSKASYHTPGKPMRGGCPVIFPWFGGHPSDSSKPAHGFARIQKWVLESVVEAEDGSVVVTLRLEPNADTTRLWPEGGDRWTLRHRITVGRALTMELELQNRGSAPISFEDALHTYFAVSDIKTTEVHGLENTVYLTIIEDQPRKTQGNEPIRFTRETDRVYLDTADLLTITDGERTLRIEKEGAASAVVWNPWEARAAAFQDLSDDEWLSMVCVETGNAKDNRVELQPGATHRSITRLSIE